MALYKVNHTIDDTHLEYFCIADNETLITDNHRPGEKLDIKKIANDVEDLNPL